MANPNSRTILITSSLLALILLLVASITFNDKPYLLVSLSVMLLTSIPLFAKFELKEIQSKEIVMLAVLSAIAAISRVPFAALPSVQPTTFVIIVSALALGPESGFIIGATAAIVSNIFLGQGPWTPWQMYAWGMVGMVAGLLRHTRFMKSMWGLLSYGVIVGFIFGWFMNLWVIFGFVKDINWETFIATYIASFYFDLAHALANVLFLALFATSWIRILKRFKRKYNILT